MSICFYIHGNPHTSSATTVKYSHYIASPLYADLCAMCNIRPALPFWQGQPTHHVIPALPAYPVYPGENITL